MTHVGIARSSRRLVLPLLLGSGDLSPTIELFTSAENMPSARRRLHLWAGFKVEFPCKRAGPSLRLSSGWLTVAINRGMDDELDARPEPEPGEAVEVQPAPLEVNSTQRL